MIFGKPLQSILGLALGTLTLAGCGNHVGLPTGTAATQRATVRQASKAVKDAFPFRMGWVSPSNPTPIVNDLPAKAAMKRLGFNLMDVDGPKKVDLRPLMSPVGDQGNFGSCTSFAMVKGMAEFMELKQIRAKGGDTAKDFVPLSPRFLWYDERSFMGVDKLDTGATMFLGMNQLAGDGACAESSFPYCPEQYQKNDLYRSFFLAEAPTKDAIAEAKQHRGGVLRQITKLSDVKASLDEGYPAVFGFTVFSSIRDARKTGMLPVPSLQEDEAMGGHATIAVGYDDAMGCLILRNSWGAEWGDKGYFYMPYDYFNTQFGLVGDGWTLRENR